MVALRPFQPPFSYELRISVDSFKSNIYNHQNDIGTDHCHLNDRDPCNNVRQSTPLDRKIRYVLTGEDPLVCGRCCCCVAFDDCWQAILRVIEG